MVGWFCILTLLIRTVLVLVVLALHEREPPRERKVLLLPVESRNLQGNKNPSIKQPDPSLGNVSHQPSPYFPRHGPGT